MVTKKEFEKDIKKMVRDKNWGVWSYPLVALDDGRELCLVVGWEEGHDKGEKFQREENGKIYTLCGQVAINIDDLQCDYNMDWYMPCNEDGDVYDTNVALEGADDLDFFVGEAKVIAEMMNKGELKIERKA